MHKSGILWVTMQRQEHVAMLDMMWSSHIMGTNTKYFTSSPPPLWKTVVLLDNTKCSGKCNAVAPVTLYQHTLTEREFGGTGPAMPVKAYHILICRVSALRAC